MEGSVIFGLSCAMHGNISMKSGKVEQSNYHDYPVCRMLETPNITVIVIDSDNPPSGVGEPGVPPVAPSITNAIAAAGGPRIKNLPIVSAMQKQSA